MGLIMFHPVPGTGREVLLWSGVSAPYQALLVNSLETPHLSRPYDDLKLRIAESSARSRGFCYDFDILAKV